MTIEIDTQKYIIVSIAKLDKSIKIHENGSLLNRFGKLMILRQIREGYFSDSKTDLGE